MFCLHIDLFFPFAYKFRHKNIKNPYPGSLHLIDIFLPVVGRHRPYSFGQPASQIVNQPDDIQPTSFLQKRFRDIFCMAAVPAYHKYDLFLRYRQAAALSGILPFPGFRIRLLSTICTSGTGSSVGLHQKQDEAFYAIG